MFLLLFFVIASLVGSCHPRSAFWRFGIESYRVFTGFLPGFTWFGRVDGVLTGCERVGVGLTRLYPILPSVTGFYPMSPSLRVSYWVFTEFDQILLGFTGFCEEEDVVEEWRH